MKLSKWLGVCLVMVLVLSACGGNNNSGNGNETVLGLEDLANELNTMLEEEIVIEEYTEEDENFELNPEDYVGSELEELIPTFQQIITTVETPRIDYDFNYDGILDVAVVLENLDENEDGGKDRTLLVALGYGDGTYHFPDYFDNLIYSSDAGGVMGDPFMGLSLDEEYDTIGISHYGGSNYRWSNTYHIGYLEQGWSLVGYSSENLNVNDMSSDSLEFDLNMGEAYYEVIDSDGNTHSHFLSAPPHGAIYLYDFNEEQFSQFIVELTTIE